MQPMKQNDLDANEENLFYYILDFAMSLSDLYKFPP